MSKAQQTRHWRWYVSADWCPDCEQRLIPVPANHSSYVVGRACWSRACLPCRLSWWIGPNTVGCGPLLPFLIPVGGAA